MFNALFEVYKTRLLSYHESPGVVTKYLARLREIENAENQSQRRYLTGERTQHCLTIQVTDATLWNSLFESERLKPQVQEYVDKCLNWRTQGTAENEFFGQMTVSLMMQENESRPGFYTAVFILNVYPHHQFITGHIIEREVQRNSLMYHRITEVFHMPTSLSVGEYLTEKQLLLYLADDDEMRTMMFGYFMDENFYSCMHTNTDPKNEYAHDCMDLPIILSALQGSDDDDDEEPQISIPPPPPVNNFTELFMHHYNNYIEQDPESESARIT